jgi:D-alanine--poly(phosphoribitol) ligase subunit 2
MKERLLEILEDINPEVDYRTCETLVDDRYIDSLGMLALVAELEDAFDIVIPAVEVIPENFNSLEGICSLVARLADES